jgi:hypothetical protein
MVMVIGNVNVNVNVNGNIYEGKVIVSIIMYYHIS